MKQSLDPVHNNLSTDRLLTVIEVMSRLSEPARLSDLAVMLGMSESTLSRFLSTLQQRDYATQDAATGRYALTCKWCGIADNVRINQPLHHVALPYLKAFCQYFEEPASLAVCDDLSVLYIDSVEPDRKTLSAVRLWGCRLPMHCTCEGKILLLEFSDREINRLIAHRGLAPMTDRTITRREDLLDELNNTRRQGYALEDEEYEAGVRAIALPIYDYTGKAVAACGICAPVGRMGEEKIKEMLSSLRHITGQISLQMGWRQTE